MSDRRNFLKAASLVPLAVVESGPARLAEQMVSPPPDDPVPQEPLTFPKSAPIQEQDFQDYNLLGKPDKDANLLGPTTAR